MEGNGFVVVFKRNKFKVCSDVHTHSQVLCGCTQLQCLISYYLQVSVKECGTTWTSLLPLQEFSFPRASFTHVCDFPT